MASTIVDLGTFPYGSDPLFTITFAFKGAGTDVTTPTVKASDEAGNTYTPALQHVGNGVYEWRFGNLLVSGTWTYRGYATGQPPSNDFTFTVDQTRNP